jgi:hypothetical protein
LLSHDHGSLQTLCDQADLLVRQAREFLNEH